MELRGFCGAQCAIVREDNRRSVRHCSWGQ